MDKPVSELFYNVVEKILAYLPSLFAGIVLFAIGWFLGWFAKRVVIQICKALRVERYLRRFRWGQDLSKADVRYGLFDFIGNLAFLVILLIFLDSALKVIQLEVISNLLERGIFFFPKIFVGLLIFGIGWFISRRVAMAMQKALLKEEVPRATLIARFAKSVLLLFFSAMALTEIDIARQVVVIGFTVVIITLGILTVVLAGLSGKGVVAKMVESLEEKYLEPSEEKALRPRRRKRTRTA
jgi:hypothetical protein